MIDDEDKTRQDKTRQDKTRQDKTRQDKTRQDKCFMQKNRNNEEKLTKNPKQTRKKKLVKRKENGEISISRTASTFLTRSFGLRKAKPVDAILDEKDKFLLELEKKLGDLEKEKDFKVIITKAKKDIKAGEEIIVHIQDSWKDIDANFTPQLEREWISKGFTCEQVRDWINIGLAVDDADFANWLVHIKGGDFADPKWCLDNANLEELKEEYANYSVLDIATIDSEIEEELKSEEPKLTTNKKRSWSEDSGFVSFVSEDDIEEKTKTKKHPVRSIGSKITRITRKSTYDNLKKSAKKEIKELKNNLGEESSQIEETDQILAEKNTKLAAIQNDLTTANTQITNLKNQLTDVENDNDRFDELLINKNDLIVSLVNELNMALTNLTTRTDERDEARHERDARADITVADLTRERQNAADALRAMTAERNGRIATTIRLNTLITERNQAQVARATAEAQRNAYETSLKAKLGLGTTDTLPTNWAEHLAKQVELMNAQTQIANLTAERDARHTVAEWDDLTNERNEAVQQRDDMRVEKEQAERARDARPDITEDEWNILKWQKSQAEAALIAAEGELNILNRQKAQLETALTAEQAAHQDTQDELTQMRADLIIANDSVRDLTAEKNQAEAAKTAAENEKARVENDLAAARGRIDTLTDERNQAEREREEARQERDARRPLDQLNAVETKIARDLNSEFKLGLPEAEIGLLNAIEKLKKIINPPAYSTIYQEVNNTQQLEELQQELKNAEQIIANLRNETKTTPVLHFGEKLADIKKIDLEELKNVLSEKAIENNKSLTEKIKNATSYQLIAQHRSQIIKANLDESYHNLQTAQQAKNNLISQQKKERIFAGTVSAAGLLTVIALIGKIKKYKSANENYRQGYKGVQKELRELREQMTLLLSQIYKNSQ